MRYFLLLKKPLENKQKTILYWKQENYQIKFLDYNSNTGIIVVVFIIIVIINNILFFLYCVRYKKI